MLCAQQLQSLPRRKCPAGETTRPNQEALPPPPRRRPAFPHQTPQIARVWKAKSLVGLAPASIYADVFLFATSVMYHVLKRNPIRAYGESVIVLFQTLMMVGLLWQFGTDEEVAVAGGGGSGSGEGACRVCVFLLSASTNKIGRPMKRLHPFAGKRTAGNAFLRCRGRLARVSQATSSARVSVCVYVFSSKLGAA